MACFLVPAALAVVTTAIQKASRRLAERLKLGLLNTLLWGAVILLALEHMWHGEVVPWPPFLTAMANPADIPVMLHEMATVGTAMSVVAVLVWLSTLAVTRLMVRAVELKQLRLVRPELTRPQ